MSLYCTLPRGSGRGKASIGRRKTWTHDQTAARGHSEYVDTLFDPILCEPNGEAASDAFQPQVGAGLIRAAQSELCLSEYQSDQSRVGNSRLYYAVDSFDDLKAIRRSSLVLEPADAGLLLEESRPNFYGGDSNFETDSAYDSSRHSSSESLRPKHRSKGSKDAKAEAQSHKGSKYFTLPSKLGRKLKKMHETEPKPRESPANSPLNLTPIASVALSALAVSPLMELQSAEVGSNMHCCCLLGCHATSGGEKGQGQGQGGPSSPDFRDFGRIHCCQQTLETLWEEGPSHEETMVAVTEDSLNSMTVQLNQLNWSLRRKDMEINHLKGTIYDMTTNGDQRQQVQGNGPSSQRGWLSKAFKGSKSRSKAEPIYGQHQLSEVTNARLVIDELKRQVTERDMILKERHLEAINSMQQIEGLKETMRGMTSSFNLLKDENERLRESINENINRYHGSAQEVNPEPGAEPTEAQHNQKPGHKKGNTGRRVIIRLGSQLIGTITVNSKTAWEQLDDNVQKLFQSYLQLTDIEAVRECIAFYEVGSEKVKRYPGHLRPRAAPELLPFGYLVEDNQISVFLNNDW